MSILTAYREYTEKSLAGGPLSFEEWSRLNHFRRLAYFYPRSPVMREQFEIFTQVIASVKARGLDPKDPEHFSAHPLVYNVIQKMLETLAAPIVSHTLYQWFAHVLMQDQGMVYSVARDLAVHLRHTEIAHVPTDLVHLPHPVMFCEIPAATGLQIYNEETGWHPLVGCYLIEPDEPILTYERQIAPQGLVKKGTPSVRRRCLLIALIGASKTDNPWDDACVNFLLFLDQPNLDDAISLCVDYYVAQTRSQPDVNRTLTEVLPTTLRFIVNILLYCTSTEPDIIERVNPAWQTLYERAKKAKSDKKRKRLHDELRHVEKQVTWVLGTRLKGKLPLPGEAESTSPGTPTGRTLQLRQIVAGHWKGVWRGTTDETKVAVLGERRKTLTWVQPYMRGPELADLVHRHIPVGR